MEKVKYNVGDTVKAREDIELISALTERKSIIKEGTIGWVAADSPLTIRWQSGQIHTVESEDEEVEIVGFNTEGIAQFIYLYLRNEFPMQDFLSNYDISTDDITECISEALSNLGLHKGDVNAE